MKNKILMTIVFYEWPAALHDIESWREKFKEHIESVSKVDQEEYSEPYKGVFYYIKMKPRNNEQELITIFPINTTAINDPEKIKSLYFSLYSSFLHTLGGGNYTEEVYAADYRFNKMLHFGSLNSLHLKVMGRIYDKFETLHGRARKQHSTVHQLPVVDDGRK